MTKRILDAILLLILFCNVTFIKYMIDKTREENPQYKNNQCMLPGR